MADSLLIRAFENKNKPVLDKGNKIVPNTYFNLVRLAKGQSYDYALPRHESIAVVMSGNCDITVDGKLYPKVGQRRDIWSGNADSVYAGTGSKVTVTANSDDLEVAVAGGVCSVKYDSFRVEPGEVDMVDVGSPETKSHRRIFHILGHNAVGRAGNLLISELYCDEGCWSGYPPHKHDCDRAGETNFEETYHYRFNPETGFGGQYCYQEEGEPQCFMTRNGDTFALRRGYHPTVTSPGHQEYIFTILVGITQRSLVQYFKEEHRHIMNNIPGIGDMVAKFK